MDQLFEGLIKLKLHDCNITDLLLLHISLSCPLLITLDLSFCQSLQKIQLETNT
jgi:hypothetical protein